MKRVIAALLVSLCLMPAAHAGKASKALEKAASAAQLLVKYGLEPSQNLVVLFRKMEQPTVGADVFTKPEYMFHLDVCGEKYCRMSLQDSPHFAWDEPQRDHKLTYSVRDFALDTISLIEDDALAGEPFVMLTIFEGDFWLPDAVASIMIPLRKIRAGQVFEIFEPKTKKRLAIGKAFFSQKPGQKVRYDFFKSISEL